MRVNDAVQSLLDAGDWWGLVGYYTGLDGVEIDPRSIWLALASVLLVMLAWRIRHRPRPVYIPLELGPVTVDLQPTMLDTIHSVFGGTSGTGKSTSVLSLFDLPIGVLCIALDNTRPIANKVRSLPDGIEWTNEEGSPGWGLGLDLLSGARPTVAAEVLVAGWAAKTATDTGKWRDIATARVAKSLELQDAMGVQRNIPDVVIALMQRSGNAEVDRACQDWASRLVTLANTLGPALGHDLDLVQAMRQQKKVVLRLNRFVHPRQAPMLGGMLLVHGRRTAQDAGVPFVLIVEEAGQMEAYAEHMSPIFQAGRDRGVPVILLTQNMSKLPLEVINNTSVWVSFAQEAKRELDFAAERLRVEPEQLQREAFKDQGRGWCYVRAPGVPTTLVRVRQQRPLKSAPSLEIVGPSVGPDTGVVDGAYAVVRQEMLDGWQPWPRALGDGRREHEEEPVPEWVGIDRDMLRMWAQTRRTWEACPLWSPDKGVWWDERGCLEWQGTPSKAGRPRSNVGKREVLVYREFYKRAKGMDPEPTFDHWCDNPICVDPEHGEPCSITDNNARRAPRKAVFKAARLERNAERRVPTDSVRGVGHAAD